MSDKISVVVRFPKGESGTSSGSMKRYRTFEWRYGVVAQRLNISPSDFVLKTLDGKIIQPTDTPEALGIVDKLYLEYHHL